jgi:L-threonylcarbamoyladenylate synthase
MKILNCQQNKINKKDLQGQVFVYPTETVYGLGCDPFDPELVEQIYQIKGRAENKPFLILADNLKTVEKHFYLNKKEKELARKYWPGALTILLRPKNKRTFSHLNCSDRVGVRISGSKLARDITRTSGGLLVSTSANISGKKPASSKTAIIDQFKKQNTKPDLLLDGGRLKKEAPSTIVLVEKNDVQVLRQGDIIIKNRK